MTSRLVGAICCVTIACACDPLPSPQPVDGAAPRSGSSAAATSTAVVHPPRPTSREGGALVRAPNEAALYLADEDHGKIRRIALGAELTDVPPVPTPITAPQSPRFVDARETSVELPGRPAQVLAVGDRVLVTVRQPGLLLVMSPGEAPKETGRAALPADAWGIAISPDLGAAYVTSAWTHKLSRVDLATLAVSWTVDVPREPRGVAVAPSGKRVYVTHLVGADLTVVDVEGPEPKVARLPLPPDPMRTSYKETLGASLGYAALLSPDGRRLFVARHALGAGGDWAGAPTIDVVSTVTGAPLAPARTAPPYGTLVKEDLLAMGWAGDGAGAQVASSSSAFVQPRAMAYRSRTRHLLVASEGNAALVELDAMSIAPGLQPNRSYLLGGLAPTEPTKIQIAPHCGAPSGVALSADENVAWVWCRSTDNVVAVRLTPDGQRSSRSETSYVENATYKTRLSAWGPFAYAKLAVDAQDEALALGRRLFYDATEPVVSGGLACSGCHPEGRDDGHVWREILKYTHDKRPTFIAGPAVAPQEEGARADGVRWGVARQTPMLASRVDAVGPYGWHGESATIVDRIKSGFSLHRFWDHQTDGKTMRDRAEPLAVFLRKGLVAPPREDRALTPQEERGRAVFMDAKTQCSTCHVPKTGYTDRTSVPLRGFKALHMFDEDPNRAYKVPSLSYVGGTAPYYHDGSFATLDELIEKNLDRMGKTMHLPPEDRAALVAFLRTL